MITCGQVPSVLSYVPEGFNTMRSASDVLLQIYLETWSLRWETLGWGTYLALQLNDITFFAFFVSLHSASLSRCLCCFPLCYFLLPKWGSSACIKFWLTLSIWCTDLCSVADHNHFYLFYSCAFLNPHHSSLTHHLNWMTSLGAAFNHFYFTAVMDDGIV